MMGDDRVRLALATIAYLGGQPEQAETIIGDISGNAAATYLKGLCCQAQGQMLKAASFYQKVFERFPESTVRDTAILAKANIFLLSKAYKSAVEEFDRVIERATNENVRAEADLRKAACLFLDGDAERGAASLREVVQNYTGTTFAARAQLLLGEAMSPCACQAKRGHERVSAGGVRLSDGPTGARSSISCRSRFVGTEPPPSGDSIFSTRSRPLCE
jgi:tetratricopeptide (TPR) repeat protein